MPINSNLAEGASEFRLSNPCLSWDVTALSPDALKSAASLYEEMKHLELRPINEISTDEVRRTLDERFGSEVLNLPTEILAPGGPLDVLRKKLGREPSITGGKPSSGA